jgi:hypothetical protein
MKFHRVNRGEDIEQYIFVCPGCNGGSHGVTVKGGPPCWTWNGDVNKPTVSPSLLINYSNGQICHFFIRDGKIEYLGDCTHELKGQTVEIPDWE